MSAAPATRPCGTCPYRRDVPSGIWDESEYKKLPRYDLETWKQLEEGATGLFYCHQQDGRLCAGWVGCHDMTQVIAVRLAVSLDSLTREEVEVLYDYETPTPLFASGQEAADHGMREIYHPGEKAKRQVRKLINKIGDRA